MPFFVYRVLAAQHCRLTDRECEWTLGVKFHSHLLPMRTDAREAIHLLIATKTQHYAIIIVLYYHKQLIHILHRESFHLFSSSVCQPPEFIRVEVPCRKQCDEERVHQTQLVEKWDTLTEEQQQTELDSSTLSASTYKPSSTLDIWNIYDCVAYCASPKCFSKYYEEPDESVRNHSSTFLG